MTPEEAVSLLHSRGLTDKEIAHVRAAFRAVRDIITEKLGET